MGRLGTGFQGLFYERIYFVQDIYRILEILYVTFARLRTSELWSDSIVPMIRKWLMGETFEIDMHKLIGEIS